MSADKPGMGAEPPASMQQVIQAALSRANTYGHGAIRLGGIDLDVLVLDNPYQWARGMADHQGDEALLFVMPEGSRYPFHMADIDRDVAIAFFDGTGRRAEAGYLQAHLGYRQPRRPYRYALEVPATNVAGLRALLGGLRLHVLDPVPK